MSTGRHSFKLNDLSRVFRAAKAAAVSVQVEITKGKMVVAMTEQGDPAAINGSDANPWDQVLTNDTTDKERSS